MGPSQVQGLVGIKPTVGLVSRAGIIPISHVQDTPGPMARTVAEAALVLGAIAGADPGDPATKGAPAARDYTAALDRGGAKNKRIGVVHPSWAAPSVKTCLAAAQAALRDLGATLVDVEEKKYDWDVELEALLVELKAGMAAYLPARGAGLRTLEDVVRFNEAHAADELRVFGQNLFERALRKGGLDAPEYVKGREALKRATQADGIDALVAEHQLDAIMAPTGGPAWLSDFVNGDAYTGAGYGVAAVAGYPSVTVPAGAAYGLPLGVCFFGPAWSEPTLLAIAFAFEQATKHRAPPTYAATVSI
jgi:amidase